MVEHVSPLYLGLSRAHMLCFAAGAPSSRAMVGTVIIVAEAAREVGWIMRHINSRPPALEYLPARVPYEPTDTESEELNQVIASAAAEP